MGAAFLQRPEPGIPAWIRGHVGEWRSVESGPRSCLVGTRRKTLMCPHAGMQGSGLPGRRARARPDGGTLNPGIPTRFHMTPHRRFISSRPSSTVARVRICPFRRVGRVHLRSDPSMIALISYASICTPQHHAIPTLVRHRLSAPSWPPRRLALWQAPTLPRDFVIERGRETWTRRRKCAGSGGDSLTVNSKRAHQQVHGWRYGCGEWQRTARVS